MSIGVVDFFNAGRRHSISVPSMDGALKPNDSLDGADVLCEIAEPDNLVGQNGSVLFSSGRRILKLDVQAQPRVNCVLEFESQVTFLAVNNDQMAVGLEDGEVRFIGGRFNGLSLRRIGDRAVRAPVAACFADDQTLILALGSKRNPA